MKSSSVRSSSHGRNRPEVLSDLEEEREAALEEEALDEVLNEKRRPVLTSSSTSLGKMSPSQFAERNICYDEGKLVSFKRRPWMRTIMDSEYTRTRKDPMGVGTKPPRWTLLRTSRQVEKSSSISFKMLALCLLIPNITSLYVSSGGANTREFGDERLENTIRISPDLQQKIGRKMKDNAYLKRFINNSRIVLRSVYRNLVGRTRGIPSDVCAIDEIQDFLPEVISVIVAGTGHSTLPMGHIRLYSGTPLTTDNIIERIWLKESTRNIWLTRCGCGEWNPPGLHQIGRRGMICSKCGRALNPLDGKWIRHGKEDAAYEGYHLSKVLMPYAEIDSIETFKQKWYELYTEVNSPNATEGSVHNEILGEAWDVGRKPLMPEHLHRVCRPYLTMSRQAPAAVFNDHNWPIFMGVDWGEGTGEGGYTVVTMMYADGPEMKPVVFYQHRYEGHDADPLEIKKDIAYLMELNNISLCVCDAGYSWSIIGELRELVPKGMARIIPLMYVGQSQVISFNKQAHRFQADRTRWMSKIIQLIRRGNVDLPCEEECWDPFCVDMLNIHAEYSDRSNSLLYSHVETDDSFHSLLYAWTALLYFYGRIDEFANA